MSTVNSVKSQKTVDSFPHSKFQLEYREQMGILRAENTRLLQELLDAQRTYQALLRQGLEEHKLQVHVLAQTMQQLALVGRLRHDTGSYSSQRSATSPDATGSLPQISVTDSSADTKLIEWLQGLRLDQGSIDRFAAEEYCLDDVLLYITRADLRRLCLRGGVELRVWKAILKWRRENRASPHCERSEANHRLSRHPSNDNGRNYSESPDTTD